MIQSERPPAIIQYAPASEECAVVRLIPVNFLGIENITDALGGSMIDLYFGESHSTHVTKEKYQPIKGD